MTSDDAAVADLDGHGEGLALLDGGVKVGLVSLGIERQAASGNARVEQVADAAAAPNPRGIDAIHIDVPLVPNDQTVFGVEHAQALDHVVDRAIEPRVMLAELATDAPRRHRSDHEHAKQRADDRGKRD